MNITLTTTTPVSTGFVLVLVALGVSTTLLVGCMLWQLLSAHKDDDDGSHLVYHRHHDMVVKYV